MTADLQAQIDELRERVYQRDKAHDEVCRKLLEESQWADKPREERMYYTLYRILRGVTP